MGDQFSQHIFPVSDKSTSDESHESNEGSGCDEIWSHDRFGCIQFRRRDYWFEAEGCKGSRRKFVGSGRRSAEKEWVFQDRRRSQSEAQIEARDTSAQRCEPFHKGALCIQSKARFKDGPSFANEKVQSHGQLRQRWAVVFLCKSWIGRRS